MEGAKFWSTLDAASAYWSMPLSETDKEKTAFSVPGKGKFEFNVTPYGLSNAGASYQRMIDICLAGLPLNRILAYIDDIVIFTSTFDQHMKELTAVFTRLRRSNISLKASKCVFASDKVDFSGYELSSHGIQPQKRLTEAINDFPCPESKREVRQFLGLAGFYRNFIQDFADISRPLNRLTGDGVPFAWDTNYQQAFELMKQRLASEPVLAFPRLGEPFIVDVDASDYAAGGVLIQEGSDGQLHPVAYFSTAFNKSQQNFAPTTAEAFALMLAVRHWYVYLAGTHFTLNSDHNPLVYLRKQKDPRGKFGRWITELEEFDYTVKYVPGVKNVKADPFSRNRAADTVQPDSQFDCKIYAMVDNHTFVEQLRMEQNLDRVISKAKQILLQGGVIEMGRLKRVQKQMRIENDLLTKSGRPILPASLRKFIVHEFHSIGHFGSDKLYAQLKQHYYWPNMYGYISLFIKSCTICQQVKCDTSPPKAPLVPMVIPDAPMQFISLDIAYMPLDNHGYQFVLLIGDIFSKFIQAVALKDQTSHSIAEGFLKNWIYVHGTPFYLLTDQGSNVDGEIVTEICNIFGIEKSRSSAYHSQGNGFAERNIRSVRDMLRAVLLHRKMRQTQWRQLLPGLVFALNMSESKAIKCVPYNVVFGGNAILPQDVLFDHNEHTRLADVTTLPIIPKKSNLR